MKVNMRDSELVIDLNVLRSNFQKMKSLLNKNVFFCPMVKADAYGMGASQVVKTLYQKESCNVFGVALIKEALNLRNEVEGNYQILVFSNFFEQDLDLYKKYNLTPIVSSFDDLQALQNFGWKATFHIKYNIGINRLSCIKLEDTKKILNFLVQNPELKPEAICSHFSHSENALSDQDEVYQNALNQFLKIQNLWLNFNSNIIFHLFNSASLVAESQKKSPQLNMGARVGLSLYGISPEFKNNKLTEFLDQLISPVFQCRSKIIRIHNVKKDEGVSYGWSWKAKRDSVIGVIPLGYADGLKRSLSNNYKVYVNGLECPLVGTICMDYCMVDVTEISQKVGIGSDVLFFSPDKLKILSIKKMAHASHSITYEIMTGWGRRLYRKYIGDS